MLLLPLLATLVATGSEQVVERALVDGVHAQVDAGWLVADMHNERGGFVVTLAKGDAIERHVLHTGDPETYVIEAATALPADPSEPSETFLQAIASPRGSFDITSGCGEMYAVPYFIDDAASDPLFASTLVTRTLAIADDVMSASIEDHIARFTVARDGETRNLVVTLAPNGKVLAAELRRYEYGSASDSVTFKRIKPMRQALHRARVVAIDETDGVTLVTAKGRFAMDPEGSGWEHPDDEYAGCGC